MCYPGHHAHRRSLRNRRTHAMELSALNGRSFPLTAFGPLGRKLPVRAGGMPESFAARPCCRADPVLDADPLLGPVLLMGLSCVLHPARWPTYGRTTEQRTGHGQARSCSWPTRPVRENCLAYGHARFIPCLTGRREGQENEVSAEGSAPARGRIEHRHMSGMLCRLSVGGSELVGDGVFCWRCILHCQRYASESCRERLFFEYV